ncbi:TetR family transcriptional regulator C-terminal domain-containing protein [Litoreibacter roseus]|uniref:TetR family transcriptional regulator n=1 Tax=Litoreibacter roseus TaxID=2601869 RepID=A0A6N6JCB1_9RHOB|nr:TetR family transcriptional regulator C-terminal domain-containing protein [Litoreibacter roseus]GFE63961.1 TetR family transcriptional regulator [Litoreibacter roseus]
MPDGRPQTRIQKKNTDAIREAALDVFSTHGFRGATLDQIAKAAGLSKPNLLYYYPSKEAIHVSLLSDLMTTWLAPLKQIDPNGQPMEEILAYVHRKLEMSRDYPRESRLFANEILQGAPRIRAALEGDLKLLVDRTVQIIENWMAEGRIARVHPYHLVFSIWSLTQHYADFDVQVRSVLTGEPPMTHAGDFLDHLYRKMLTPA